MLPPLAGNPIARPMGQLPDAPSDDDQLLRLRQARGGFITQLAEMSTQRKPSYEIGSQKVDWTEYGTYLREQIAGLSLLINQLDPQEEIMQGYC